MLKQWSKKVLQKWMDVYTLLLPKMAADVGAAKLEKECVDMVLKMSEKSSPL